ncbi:MAG: TRAP transporter small permease subunit [Roseibium album]|uniref:TRAP transporter small permease n=1 Tax=Roseibium album TaxID=311410 RepID=UPI001A35324D|nr:TRAP transporter small permease subunit [Roseibium album]MBG6146389.1 TRAP-type C4-dicarboxylate transport system permease small subunit [Labrenzia sp. EL_142]MBG6156613.1 TRAP-type C4-dicarboxylate transport system permease small subunit [Labrenzia sp. EL_162]MBG6164945.1 TRAP-type C4-dicarboxylate transport system permease small subunit [Labrenzia sp. EL_195]MBG6195447.1 TRAP-type C4-dicarboxylate transport system permease small subunit [Labrenzia sp. EL_159]MBG6208275.1 TRAP-type C4-dica
MKSLAERISLGLNRAIEAVVALLMLALVFDVWIGVIDRYWFHWQLPWPETLARYLMIWAALLAVSSGIARREHIGLTSFLMTLPAWFRRAVLITIDILAISLFLYVFWFGIGFAQSGATRQAMIFGVTLEPFFWAIPTSAFLAIIQLALVLIRDQGLQLEQSAEASA